MKVDKKVILYVIAVLLVLALLVMTFFPNMIYAFRDAGRGNGGEDKCTPPPGQTEEEWKEHMSHHPDIYAECF